jgi:hypothetical protein
MSIEFLYHFELLNRFFALEDCNRFGVVFLNNHFDEIGQDIGIFLEDVIFLIESHDKLAGLSDIGVVYFVDSDVVVIVAYHG